jgi:hypothetical protein
MKKGQMNVCNRSGDVSALFSRIADNLRLASALCVCLVAPVARAIDVDPGDYTGLPAGTNLGVLYGQFAERNSVYAGGSRVPINPGLDSEIGILRPVHYMNVGGYLADVQFLLPFGHLSAKDDLSPLGGAHGVGDLILASTLWLVNNHDTRTYFGITPFLYVPTGSYDKNSALNLGENRWKFALQAGFSTPLIDKVLFDSYADVTLYGNNNEYGPRGQTLAQNPSYQLQGFLRYTVSTAWDLRGGISYSFGGESRVDGSTQDDRLKTWKFQVGTGWFVTPAVQLLAMYGRDFSVENGLKESNRVNLRVMKVL